MTCNLLLFKQDHLLLLRTEPWINAPGPAPALILPDFFAGLQDFVDSVGPLPYHNTEEAINDRTALLHILLLNKHILINQGYYLERIQTKINICNIVHVFKPLCPKS